MRDLPFSGLCESWSQALGIAVQMAQRTGRRHRVERLGSRTKPEWLPHCDGKVWHVREVDPCS